MNFIISSFLFFKKHGILFIMGKRKYIARILSLVLLILLGIFMFVYGGYDDSPGAQLIGLIAVVAGIIGVVRTKRKVTRTG